MIHSMTAFARADASHGTVTLTWELRSVNHRYLEPSFKLPETLRSLEPALRARLRDGVHRGKLECGLRVTDSGGSDTSIDETTLAQLLANVQVVRSRISCAPLNPLELLRWPGVLTGGGGDDSALAEPALTAFDSALAQLLATRAREGAALAALLFATLDRIEQTTAAIREQLPAIGALQAQRLRERLADLTRNADPGRLEQELVLLAQKSDVTEELDRLQTHISEVRRTLQQGGPCGRRLDFLMQELNREANTLSSKAVVSATSQAAVELKVAIEQMREQIQNIE